MMNKMSRGSTVRSSDLIDAKLEEHQLCGSKQCPRCGHKFLQLEGKPDWLGLPAGVKFDPTDQELIEHLEAKLVEAKNMKSHPLIDEFIPTIEGEDGICYTHPEKLPGVTRDGLSRHFFHRPSKAYTTGTRKRRKIQNEWCDLQQQQQQQGGETRWHKTGKTRPVMVNGKQKGCKKILVLYTNFGKNRKPEKTNWVMHQYHLGLLEEEKDGELVVSKIFYQTQPRQCNWSAAAAAAAAAATITTGGEGNDGIGTRDSASTGGSCSSSKEMLAHDMSAIAVPPITSFPNAFDMQHLKSQHLSVIPFTKTFHQVEIGGEVQVHERHLAHPHHHHQHEHEHEHEHDHHQHQHQQHDEHAHHQQIANTAAFHISRPSNPISTIITPPPLHHASLIQLDHNSFHQHVSRIFLQNDHFQEQQQLQHHKQLGGGGRSASGLEELIMGCTSTDNIKDQSSIITIPQEADQWLKYSPYWPDPAGSS